MNMSQQDVLDVVAKIFAAFDLFLIVASVILNSLVLYICLRSKKLRSNSTFKLLAFNSINDVLVCIAWNEESFTGTYFDLQLYFRNLFYCRWICMLLQTVTIELASWMLVSLSLDRLLSMSIKLWSKHYFIGARPYIYAALLALVVVLINIDIVFVVGYEANINGTDTVVCFVTSPDQSFDWYQFNVQMSVYFGFIVPYAFLIIINVLIIYKATRFERAQKHRTTATVGVAATTTAIIKTPTTINSHKRKAQMTRTILFITFLYVIATLPSAVFNAFNLYNYFDGIYITFLINLMNASQFWYPAFNFFILYFSNKIFVQEVNEVLGLNINRQTNGSM